MQSKICIFLGGNILIQPERWWIGRLVTFSSEKFSTRHPSHSCSAGSLLPKEEMREPGLQCFGSCDHTRDKFSWWQKRLFASQWIAVGPSSNLECGLLCFSRFFFSLGPNAFSVWSHEFFPWLFLLQETVWTRQAGCFHWGGDKSANAIQCGLSNAGWAF